MADEIARDLGIPFDPSDTRQLQEFNEFGCPPDSANIAADLNNPSAVNSRAHRLFNRNLFMNRVGPIDLTDPVALPTPDAVVPQVIFELQGMNRDTNFAVPGLGSTEIWSFSNGEGGFIWPGPTIRIKEGQVAHTLMSNSRGQHTIHHHGIEPTPINDGVGHLTFDIQGSYNYQWLPTEAGTYFYHCHVNTTLHFEMGMYGMLIVDPNAPGAPYANGGAGFTYIGNNLAAYQAEAIWVTDDIDTNWHAGPDGNGPEHGTGSVETGVLCGQFVAINDEGNPHLHDFNPDVFVISGQLPASRAAGERHLIPSANVTLARGQRLLVRVLNAGYTTTRYYFPSTLQGQVVAVDGRTLGRAPFGLYSSPFSLASIEHKFALTTAQRWDILIDTTGAAPGQHFVNIDFHHWITDQIFDFGRLRARITVT